MKLLYYKEEDIQEKIERLKKYDKKLDTNEIWFKEGELSVLEELLSEGKDVEEVFNAGSRVSNYNTNMDIEWKFPTYTDFLNSIK